MRIAILTLTRDRLAYTKHCFETLRENAGCDFDWFILDQGSQDGTPEWLLEQDDLDVTLMEENIGICRGLNLLLDTAVDPRDYDVLVRYDNDCEVLTPDTLVELARLAVETNRILAPRVLGLKNPPATLSQDGSFSETMILGGIFMVIPAALFTEHGYRYRDWFPPYAGDEDICRWWREKRGKCGYIEDFQVNHYLTSEGQERDDIPYYERKKKEIAA